MTEYRISFHQALQAWEKYHIERQGLAAHLPTARLQQVWTGAGQNLPENWLMHLASCASCSHQLTAQQDRASEAREEFWDTTWRKAAATGEITYPLILTPESKNYTVEIRKSETQPDAGLILVIFTDRLKKRFENKKIMVTDGKGRTLLRGTVENGEVFDRLESLSTIDLHLSVRTID